MNHNDELDCGLDGEDKDSVTIGRFNRWVSFALRHHLIPLKKQVGIMLSFQEEERQMHARILGGIVVLKWLLPIFSVIVNAAVIFIFYTLHQAGML